MCINLRKRFGTRYRVKYEESYYAQYGPSARTVDPWYMVIPCLHGEIIPWGDDILAACTIRRGPVAEKLSRLPCTTMWQSGSDGVSVKFHVDDIKQVAKIMKPRRRRQLSPEQRQALIARLEAYRFAAGKLSSGGLERTQSASDDSQVTKGGKR